jgi:hypothetical protein
LPGSVFSRLGPLGGGPVVLMLRKLVWWPKQDNQLRVGAQPWVEVADDSCPIRDNLSWEWREVDPMKEEAAGILSPKASWSARPQCSVEPPVVWTSLGPQPQWVPGPTTRWASGTTRLVPHGT